GRWHESSGASRAGPAPATWRAAGWSPTRGSASRTCPGIEGPLGVGGVGCLGNRRVEIRDGPVIPPVSMPAVGKESPPARPRPPPSPPPPPAPHPAATPPP